MSLVDDRGRLFGRINLFDAAIVGFIVVLIPMAYGTTLLFRTPTPRILSVARAEITKEERRIAGGRPLTAKLKVRGSGLRPLLRASIDGVAAMGFVFEDPNSADVLVGDVPPGTHDLVLFDGVQEVARARGAVTIQATLSPLVRLVGAFVNLDRTTAESLRAGLRVPETGDVQVQIVQLGPIEAGRRRIVDGTRVVDLPTEGLWQRPAVIVVRCDQDASNSQCSIGGRTLGDSDAHILTVTVLATPMTLLLEEVLPDAPPRTAEVRVRFGGNAELTGAMRVGDRDAFLDERAAAILSLNRRVDGGAAVVDATLRVGVDGSGNDWRYRGRVVKPGVSFTLATDRYVVIGSVVALNPAQP